MTTNLPPSDRMSKRLFELLDSQAETEGLLEERIRRMALEMVVRGLSTRDIRRNFCGETLVDQDGKPLLSRSSVSRLTEALHEEYEAFAARDLSDLDVVYLFVDGVYEAVRSYTRNQAILCAWAICADGTKQMLHLACAGSETKDVWSAFFEEMTGHGLRQPLVRRNSCAVSDGAKGLMAAIEEHLPQAGRQRCLACKLRNLASKLPRDPELRAPAIERAKAVYYAPDRETAGLLAERLIEGLADEYPTFVKCFSDDLEACLTHLDYPRARRRYIRTTNLLERSFVEEKRRTKVIPHHVNERGATTLVFGVLIRAAHRWNRVMMTRLEPAQLRNIRKLMRPDSDDTTQTISLPLAA